MKSDDQWFTRQIVERFIKYVKIDTTSDRHKQEIPSTPCQWDLLHLLDRELEEIGIQNRNLDEHGYLIARLESNIDEVTQPPVIGFMAHVDTSEDVSGKNVSPIVHEHYDGAAIELKDGVTLKTAENPLLSKYAGKTIITSDGTTLLGADDKAGIAEILTAAAWMQEHPEVKHGAVELIFTPDEETGKGLNLFPLKKLDSICCYTMDGDEEGTFEDECFHGHTAEITFNGIVIHPGDARGRLMNAVTMAGELLSMLPRNESPEATDGRFGYYCPLDVRGNIEQSVIEIIIRDFDLEQIKRRSETLRRIGKTIESTYPGSKVHVEIRKQYSNMRLFLDKDTRVIHFLEKAIEMEGLTPKKKYIRGGTDGARLSEMGIPTPNVFTGGANFHSKKEWIVLPVMINAVRTIINLIRLWSAER